MTTSRELTVREARKKGITALASGIGTLAASAILANVLWFIGLIALIAGGLFTVKKVKDWLHFRGENGLYF